MNSHDGEGSDLAREQGILGRWAEWVERELPNRRAAADRAYKRALQVGDEAAWQHAEIMERSHAQLGEMIDHQDPYFARIQGRMRDVDGQLFSVDLRVHRYHRSETFPDADGGELLDISHLAPLADLVRNPVQTELALTMTDREFLQMAGTNPRIEVLDCTVEDVELDEGRVVRVAPRYGAIFEDRVRRRLAQSAVPALDVLADVLDREQNAIVGNRAPHLKLVILDGPAGTGKTVVAAHRIAVAVAPDSPGFYLTPTTTLRDYVRPVLPRLGLERSRAQAWSIADLAAMMWPDLPWDSDLSGMLPDNSGDPQAWLRSFEDARRSHGNSSWLGIYQMAAGALGQSVGAPLGLADVAPLLMLGVVAKRPRPQPEPHWIIIDEAQAIPLLAYSALRVWLGSEVSWVVAGDLMQQGIQREWDGWSGIQDALGLKNHQVANLWLAKSYRVPPRVHHAAEQIRQTIWPDSPKSESVPWHPHVGDVTISRCATRRAEVDEARRILDNDRQQGYTAAAMLVPDLEHLTTWAKDLDQWNIEYQVLRDNVPYRGGLVLTTLDMVRGLEFDAVVLLDVSAQAYPNLAWAARKLYTSLTRSRRAVHLLAVDSPEYPSSSWLNVISQ